MLVQLFNLKEMQAKKEAEMVQKIIEKVTTMKLLSTIISILVVNMTRILLRCKWQKQ